MQIVVKPVMETLGLRIYGYMKELGRENEDTIKQLFDFCINRPCLLQWKLMRILGTSLAFSLVPFMDFFNKVIRKFY